MIKWIFLLVPLFGPSLLWLGWQFYRLRRAEISGTPIEAGQGGLVARMPIAWLAPLSGVLFIASLAVFGVLNRAPPDSVYEPSRLVDGEIVGGSLAPEEP